jgi:hypothetical protein
MRETGREFMRAVWIFLGAALLAGTAFADDSAMTVRFGNTTITKSASGPERHVYYKADGTFTGKQGKLAFGGTWKLKGSMVCLTTSVPVPGLPSPACTSVGAHKIGDTWTAGPNTVSLVAGIR